MNGAPQQHTWASFVYRNPDLTIQTNFPGLINVGPQNGSTLKVLSQVTLNDGSRFNFDYTSWGQIWKISHFATDGQTLLNYRTYNLPLDASAPQTDCPRFTEGRDWARNWNGDTNGLSSTSEETQTLFAVPAASSWTMPDGTPQTGTLAQVTTPDGTIQKIYSHASGWDKGLPLLTETHGSSNPAQGAPIIKQKAVATSWTQDNTAVTFLLNPRVLETNVYDFDANGQIQNRARTRVTYQTVSLPDGTACNLPQDVFEYQANATTVLRRTHTDYNLTTPYTSRRIIGLASERTLFEVDANTQAETLMSKVGFEYDETGSIQGNDAPIQHDNTNYTSSFVMGRANLSSVKRYDVFNTSLFVTSISKYNTAGSVVQTTDPAGHQVQLSYTDKFAANGILLDPALSFTTLAYPTTVTDADGYTSSTRYHYDFGAPTWKQRPLPNTTVNTPGPEQKLTYDGLGRLEQVTSLANNAYTKFIYRPNYIQSFTTVNNVADEAQALQVFDGSGRRIATAGNHPGSTGGFSGTLIHYDSMGRAIKQSNPTETSISVSGVPILPYGWQATGDDAQGGWVYTLQNYDWKGRPLVTTNPSITGNPADTTTKEASYTGCGCAGGEVVTITDEGTIDADVPKRRQQKIYSDILGRNVKTEVLNWQGGSVYSATVNTYNARDQVTSVRQYQGAATTDGTCPSGTCQEATTTYDGHGRLKSRHLPEQNVGTNTVWDYNPNDTIQTVTDARGASATYGYNNRHLVTAINYSAPAGITPTSNVSFGYDAAGNRTSMTDGLGSVSYNYNELSRMTSETRTFNGIGSFSVSYDYNLAGELKKITDSTNMTINYGYDSVGRLNGVTGSDNLFMGIANYASNFQYRAWGGLKTMTDGNNRTSSLLYNPRLQPSHFEISGNNVSQNYDYYNDGRIRFVHNTTDPNFDRSYFYDYMARLSEAKTGGQARGDAGASPYYETFGYDVFSNLTGRQTNNWNQDTLFDSATYTNNRRGGWGYDADGRNTTIGTRTYNFDADGQMTLMTGQRWVINHYVPVSQSVGYDGDGRKVKEVASSVTTYYLTSSVLDGAIVEEISVSLGTSVGYVYSPGGELLARQHRVGSSSYIAWKRLTPAGTGEHDHNVGGVFGSGVPQRIELDPLGANVPLEYLPPPEVQNQGDIGPGQITGIAGQRWANFFDLSGGCTVNGVAASCSDGMSALNALGAPQVRLLSVTINIKWKNGDKRTIQFVTSSAGIRSGFNHTFRGGAAVEAASAWNKGLSGGFENALMGSIIAGFAAEGAQARKYAHAPQNPDRSPPPILVSLCLPA